jgi:hypothetical protein
LKRITSDLVELPRSISDPQFNQQQPERTMKTKFYLAGGVCAASLAFCMPLNAQLTPATTASPAASPATSPAAKPATRPIPFRGKISAVDQTAKTFTLGGKEGSRVFKVTDSTKIMKAGAPGTMADIVENEQARGSYFKQADGTLEAKTVRIGPKAAGEKKGRKGKKGAAEEAAPTP